MTDKSTKGDFGRYAVIDFETRICKDQKYSLKAMSDIEYIMDPRFETLSVAIYFDGKFRAYPGNSSAWLAVIQELVLSGICLVAHNGRFDFRILALRFGIFPSLMSDTMLISRYFGFPEASLGYLSNLILKENKGELPNVEKPLRELKELEWLELVKYNIQDTKLTIKLYRYFLPVIPHKELLLIDQTLKICLKQNEINWASHEDMLANANTSLELILKEDEELFLNKNKINTLKKIIQRRTGIFLNSVDKKKVTMSNLDPAARTILQKLWSAKEISKHVNDLITLSKRSINPQNRKAMVELNYSKAITHRWSCGGDEDQSSFNFQNMKKNGGIRELWVPDKGHLYIIWDLAQIEARVTAWYAGEHGLLKSFQDGKDVYCEFGQEIFGHVLDKIKEPSERKICKEAILGLGFGMGPDKFHSRLQNSAPDALEKATSRLGLSDGLRAVKHIVNIYKRTYPSIAKMPRLMNQYVDNIINSDAFSPLLLDNGKIEASFTGNPKCLKIKLPSGSSIYYRDIKIKLAPDRYRKEILKRELSYRFCKNIRTLGYSTLFENIVQATARDILAFYLLGLENESFDIRMHTHDEVVIQIPENSAFTAYKRICSILSSPVPGIGGLPIAADVALSDQYTKSENYLSKFTKDQLNRGEIGPHGL